MKLYMYIQYIQNTYCICIYHNCMRHIMFNFFWNQNTLPPQKKPPLFVYYGTTGSKVQCIHVLFQAIFVAIF